jgi:hypothetical protein
MNSRLAMITFLDGGAYPDQGLPGQPPYPSTGPGFPTHPIAPGGQPPGIWGGAPPWVSHPIAPGGSPGVPTHPIYNPPYPSTGPGFPTHPIAPGGQPPYPTTGPVFPPVTPDNTLPPVPGAPPPQVSLPIVLPPTNKPVEPDALFELKWSPIYGWVLVPIKDEDEAQPKKK